TRRTDRQTVTVVRQRHTYTKCLIRHDIARFYISLLCPAAIGTTEHIHSTGIVGIIRGEIGARRPVGKCAIGLRTINTGGRAVFTGSTHSQRRAITSQRYTCTKRIASPSVGVFHIKLLSPFPFFATLVDINSTEILSENRTTGAGCTTGRYTAG